MNNNIHNKSSHVVMIGHVTADSYVQSLQKISLGDKFFVRNIKTLPGGMIANAACVSSALGTQTYFISALGEDETTEMLLDSFAPFDVNIDYVDVIKSCENFKTTIILHKDGRDRTIMLYENSKKPVAIINEKKIELLHKATYIYGLISDFKTFPNYQTLFSSLKKNGTKFMFDVEASTFTSKHNKSDQFFFELADVLSFNSEAAIKYSGATDGTGFEELTNCSNKIIIITKGADGCIALWDNNVEHFPAYDVSITDTTGAGDTFNAAFLHAFLNTKNVMYSIKFATAAAGRSIQYLGARSGAVSNDLVINFMKSNKLKT